MARLTDLYISNDMLDGGETYITGVTDTIDASSTDNEIATAKAVYDASSSGGLDIFQEVKVFTPDTPGTAPTYIGTPAGCATSITITSDNTGKNDIIINTANGVRTIAEIISVWNTSNPTYPVTLITGDDTQVVTDKIDITLSGGADDVYTDSYVLTHNLGSKFIRVSYYYLDLSTSRICMGKLGHNSVHGSMSFDINVMTDDTITIDNTETYKEITYRFTVEKLDN